MRYEAVNDKTQEISLKETENSYAFLHFHRSIELHYVLKGKYEMTIGATTEILDVGDIGFVPSYFPHSIKPLKASLDDVLIIPNTYYSPFEKEEIKLTYTKLSNKDINKKIYEYITLIKDRLEELNTKRKNYDLRLQGYTNILLSLIVDNYQPQNEKNVTVKNSQIEQIIEYIDEHYNEEITLEVIAKKFGYTKYYFSKLFNKIFNCNLRQYINNIRVYHIIDNQNMTNKTSAILNAGYKNLSTYYKYKKRVNNYENSFNK